MLNAKMPIKKYIVLVIRVNMSDFDVDFLGMLDTAYRKRHSDTIRGIAQEKK
jgi:hypothetical protein